MTLWQNFSSLELSAFTRLLALEETDHIEEIVDEIDQKVQVAEPTDRSSLQTQLRAFFNCS